jgi:predicted transcriptional regulator
LSAFDQLREIAMEVALLALGEPLQAELEALDLSSGEARRLGRFELARYGAHALMMPYATFLSAAIRARYDIDILRARFNVSFEQVANRLTMLQRPGAVGLPFFLMEIDNAGNRFRRSGAQGYPHAKFGGACPKLNVHAAFAQPGQVLVEQVEMPDGAGFLTISRTLEGPQAGFGERIRRTAVLMGCDIASRDEVAYAAALPDKTVPPIGVGAACRLCERSGCLARAEPPLTRPLGLDEMVTGLSAFDFQ